MNILGVNYYDYFNKMLLITCLFNNVLLSNLYSTLLRQKRSRVAVSRCCSK